MPGPDGVLGSPAARPHPRGPRWHPCQSCEHMFVNLDRDERVVTSAGSAYARFRRALEGGTPLMVKAAAAELARIGLDDALAVCLLFLDREPQLFPRAAARWVGRLMLEQPVALSDAHLALASLGALLHGNQRAGAESLIELCASYQLPRIEMILTAWLDQHGLTP